MIIEADLTTLLIRSVTRSQLTFHFEEVNEIGLKRVTVDHSHAFSHDNLSAQLLDRFLIVTQY